MARNYILRGGTYEGVYKIYNDLPEFHKELPGKSYHTWSKSEPSMYRAGEHIEAEDGFIVPILHVRLWKVPKNLRERYFIRFPMGTFAIWRLKNGNFRWSRFYAMYTVNDKSSGSQLQRSTHRMQDENLKRFAILVAGGMDIKEAYVLSHNVNVHLVNMGTLQTKATNLLRKDIVMSEINQAVAPFRDKIGEKWDNKKILEMMDEHDKAIKPGTAVYQKWMEFVMELRGLISSKKSKAALNLTDEETRTKKAEEATYTEVPPDQLGPPPTP